MTTAKEWWGSNYAEDIHGYLRQKERARFLYRGCSPQLYMRRGIIRHLDNVCEKMEFCTTVKHLAVYLLDIFMDNHVINSKHMEMVTIGCLIVAVKLEEQDRLVPKHSDFQKYVVQKYKLCEFVQMEVSILTFFNWDILFPTVAHFTEYYLLFCIQPTDLLNGRPVSCYDDVPIFFEKYIDYFLDVVIRDQEYLAFKPSMVAASCIAATRHCLMLTPSWPKFLQDITLYKYSEIQQIVDLLVRALDEDMIKQFNRSAKNVKHSCMNAKKEAIELETAA